MDYMDMLKRGWAITWDNKYLWILGFLAALGSGNSVANYTTGSDDFAATMDPAMIGALAAGVAAASCVGVIIGIIIWLVSMAAKAGLIESVARIELAKPLDGFGQAFRLGWGKVWRMAGLTLLLFGVVILAVLLLIFLFILSGGAFAALFSGGEDATGTLFAGLGILGLCLLGLLCLLIPVFIALNFVYAFAMRGLVLRDLGVTDSIRHGYQVLRDNLGPILMLALAFLLFNIIALVITAAILVPLGLGVGIPLALLSGSDATFLQGLLTVLGVVAATVVAAIISMIIVTWQSSTFTLAYLEFTGRDIDFAAK